MIIWAVVISIRVFYLHLHVLLGMWPSPCPAQVWVWSVWFMPWRLVGWSLLWPTVISGSITQRAANVWMIYNVTSAVCHGEVCGCVLCRLSEIIMSCFFSGCVYLVLWSRVASMQITMTQAAMSLVVGLWSGLALPVSIFPVVPGAPSGMMTFLCLVICHWCSGRRYSVWAVHDNMTVFIAFVST